MAIARVCDWELRSRDLKGLSDAAQAFVRRVDAHSMFNRKGGRALLACARTMDEITALEAAVRVEGATVSGSRGRPRKNPKLAELRRLERAVARVLRHFHLSPDGTLNG
jgi:hypothetical protein